MKDPVRPVVVATVAACVLLVSVQPAAADHELLFPCHITDYPGVEQTGPGQFEVNLRTEAHC